MLSLKYYNEDLINSHLKFRKVLFIYLDSFYKLKNFIYLNISYIFLFFFPIISTFHKDTNLPTYHVDKIFANLLASKMNIFQVKVSNPVFLTSLKDELFIFYVGGNIKQVISVLGSLAFFWNFMTLLPFDNSSVTTFWLFSKLISLYVLVHPSQCYLQTHKEYLCSLLNQELKYLTTKFQKM